MTWIEVGKSDCRECGGIGVEPGSANLIGHGWTKRELIKRGCGCRACKGTGQKSVGYQDLRDASGR